MLFFDYIKKSSEAVAEATGVHADRVSYGGIDSRGIIVKIFDNQKGEVGHYIFTYNVNTNMCTLDSIQAGPVVYIQSYLSRLINIIVYKNPHSSSISLLYN